MLQEDQEVNKPSFDWYKVFSLVQFNNLKISGGLDEKVLDCYCDSQCQYIAEQIIESLAVSEQQNFYYYFEKKICKFYYGNLEGCQFSFSEGDYILLYLKKTSYSHTFILEGYNFEQGDEDTSDLLFNNYKRNLEYFQMVQSRFGQRVIMQISLKQDKKRVSSYKPRKTNFHDEDEKEPEFILFEQRVKVLYKTRVKSDKNCLAFFCDFYYADYSCLCLARNVSFKNKNQEIEQCEDEKTFLSKGIFHLVTRNQETKIVQWQPLQQSTFLRKMQHSSAEEGEGSVLFRARKSVKDHIQYLKNWEVKNLNLLEIQLNYDQVPNYVEKFFSLQHIRYILFGTEQFTEISIESIAGMLIKIQNEDSKTCLHLFDHQEQKYVDRKFKNQTAIFLFLAQYFGTGNYLKIIEISNDILVPSKKHIFVPSQIKVCFVYNKATHHLYLRQINNSRFKKREHILTFFNFKEIDYHKSKINDTYKHNDFINTREKQKKNLDPNQDLGDLSNRSLEKYNKLVEQFKTKSKKKEDNQLFKFEIQLYKKVTINYEHELIRQTESTNIIDFNQYQNQLLQIQNSQQDSQMNNQSSQNKSKQSKNKTQKKMQQSQSLENKKGSHISDKKDKSKQKYKDSLDINLKTEVSKTSNFKPSDKGD